MRHALLFTAFVCGCAHNTPATPTPASTASTASTAEHTDHDGDAHACACAAGKAGETVWCDECGKGYIGGEATTDQSAVDAARGE